MLSALITNERGQREWLYLIHRFGEARVLKAISEIPGDRRPYPLNVARVLKVSLPKPDDLPFLCEPGKTAAEKANGLAAIRAMLTELQGHQES